MSARRVRVLAAAVAALAASAGCASTPRPSVDIGMARIGLTRAFTDTDLKPLPPQVILRLVPSQANMNTSPDLAPIDVAPPATVRSCPKAPAGATVPAAAPLTIPTPPKPGFYRLHNEGTITVASGPLTLSLPFPPDTYEEVSDVHEVEVSTVPGLPPTKRTQFTLTTTLSLTYVVKEVYQYDATQMDLISRVETSDGATVSDDWMPPVEEYATGGVGTSWQDIATDLEARKTLTIDGKIPKKTVVDACGSLIDTVEVNSNTTVVDIGTRQTSGTTTGKTDIARVATSLGGLFAQRETHSTSALTVDNVPVTIVIDVVSTLADLTPSAAPPFP